MHLRRTALQILLLSTFVLLSPACSMDLSFLEKLRPSRVLFEDDFSTTDSGWDQTTGADGETNYAEGAYRIYVADPQKDIWANPGLDFTDVQIEVDATKAGGPDQNDFGVICRYQDKDNFYFFLLSSSGFYAIGKFEDGEQNILAPDETITSDLILPGEATNHIRADCVGDKLRLYANGEELLEVEDSQFKSGDIGLIAGTFELAGTDVLFDNFVVRKP